MEKSLLKLIKYTTIVGIGVFAVIGYGYTIDRHIRAKELNDLKHLISVQHKTIELAEQVLNDNNVFDIDGGDNIVFYMSQKDYCDSLYEQLIAE